MVYVALGALAVLVVITFLAARAGLVKPADGPPVYDPAPPPPTDPDPNDPSIGTG